MVQSVIDPNEVMVIGGTYQIPVWEGLLDENFVDTLKLQGTYSEDSFGREFLSEWSGGVNNAFFSNDQFDKHRVLQMAEKGFGGRSQKSVYYVIAADIGRYQCPTEICVFKCTPQLSGSDTKSLVNLYSLDAEDFEYQALVLKKLYYKFKAKIIVLDGNGLGAGLIDFMYLSQIDPETGESYPPFGVTNDEKGYYKKRKVGGKEADAIYQIKADAAFNTEAYSYAQTQMASGKIKFLIDESQAKSKLMATKVGQNMDYEERNDYLLPYVQTTMLKNQLLNLVQENDGINIILKQSSKGIKKDKVSAFIYGLHYIKEYENGKRRKKNRSITDFMFFS